jgi:elongation factor G
LIDTPGHQDFRFEVDRCLPVLDGAVCILDAVKGVEAHTERVWASAQEFKIPRIIYVNKLDRDGASFKKSVLDVASKLGAWPLVCQIPFWDKDDFIGVVDVLNRVGIKWVSADKWSLIQPSDLKQNEDLWQEIETARSKLVERLCEDDDTLVEEFSKYGDDLPTDMLKASIRRAISSGDGNIAPVFAGASLRNMGVQPLLDAIVDYLPSPQERPDLEVFLGSEKHHLEEVLQNEPKVPKTKSPRTHNPPVGAIASIFKVVNAMKNVKDSSLITANRGMLAFVRVYHGSLHKNSQVWNANLGIFEKPFNLVQVSADRISEIPHLSAGQIGAINGLKAARTGDTLHVLPSHSHKSPNSSLKRMTVRPAEIAPAVAFISIFDDGG